MYSQRFSRVAEDLSLRYALLECSFSEEEGERGLEMGEGFMRDCEGRISRPIKAFHGFL